MGRVVRYMHWLRELYRHQTMAHAGSTYLNNNTKKRPSPTAPEIVFFFWPASITIRCTCIQILYPDDGGGPFGVFDFAWAQREMCGLFLFQPAYFENGAPDHAVRDGAVATNPSYTRPTEIFLFELVSQNVWKFKPP